MGWRWDGLILSVPRVGEGGIWAALPGENVSYRQICGGAFHATLCEGAGAGSDWIATF